MNKKKIYCQIAVCMILTTAAVCGGEIKNEAFSQYYDKAKSAVMETATVEDIKAVCLDISAALSGAPAKVASAVAQAGTASKYGAPIDEKSETALKQVHAAAGGMVIASGKDREMGLYIKIKHEDAVTVYGNLDSVGVVESERVQRGEIIGSYNEDCGKDFFYELQENL